MGVLKKKYSFGGTDYQVYSDGRIFGPSGKQLKVRKNSDGYVVVTIGNKNIRRTAKTVHSIVAEQFVPNPNNLSEVDHKDGNRMNASMENLEYVEHVENIRRAYEKGSYKGRCVGVGNPKAKLNDGLVMRLREEYKTGVTIKELCDKYGYPWNTIGNAVKGYTWKHLPI